MAGQSGPAELRSDTAGVLAVGALLAAGVEDVVLSPGSRSAPLALAAAAAERAGDLRLHVRLDERSAGFLAVGLAKVSGRPVAVICTSGTAAANLGPAVVEARYSGTPLVVVTADRPPEARGRGASQTIAQPGMFDTYVHASWDLPVPQDAGDPDGWADQLSRATATAARMRGPVHLNVPLRPPLVADRPAAWSRYESARTWADTAESPARETLSPAARGVIVVGDLDVGDSATRADVTSLAAATGWPIVAEASANLAACPHTISAASLFLADPRVRERLRPGVVVTVGPFGLDRGVLALVRSAGEHLAVRIRPRTDPPDPLATAARVLDAVPLPGPAEPDPAWLADWRAASQLAAGALAESREPGPPAVLDVAAAVWGSLSDQHLLVVASSLSIRQVGIVAKGSGPAVLANRGANGIDGLVSTAWGAASAWGRRGNRRRTVVLLGDLALLHDQNGFLVPDGEPAPDLTFVVPDNNGGGIFATLEQGAPGFADDFDRVFGTPHDRDLVAVLAAAGVPAERVPTTAALADRLRAPGVGVRALVVPCVDPREEAARLRALVTRIALEG